MLTIAFGVAFGIIIAVIVLRYLSEIISGGLLLILFCFAIGFVILLLVGSTKFFTDLLSYGFIPFAICMTMLLSPILFVWLIEVCSRKYTRFGNLYNINSFIKWTFRVSAGIVSQAIPIGLALILDHYNIN